MVRTVASIYGLETAPLTLSFTSLCAKGDDINIEDTNLEDMLPSISVSPPIRLSPCTIIGACPSFLEEKAFAPSFEIESRRGCIGLFLRLESPVIIVYP